MKTYLVEYIGKNDNLDVETLFIVIKENIKNIDSSRLRVRRL